MEPTAATRKSSPIYLLDWLRFLAAIMVAGWHLGFRLFDPDAGHINRFAAGLPMGDPLLPDATMFGWEGVQIFFVISGVVISFSASRATPARFFINRAGRLFPVVLCSTLAIAAIDLLIWQMPWAGVIKSAALTLVFSPIGNLAPQFWTIPVEIVFYATVWMLILSHTFHRVERLALAFLLASGAYWLAVFGGVVGPHTPIARNLLLQHGAYFAIGIVLYRIATGGVTWPRIAMLVLGCVVAMFEMQFAIQKYHISDLATPLSWTIPYGVWLVSIGVIWLALTAREAIARTIERYRLASFSRALGLSTYPFYLLHIHVGGLFVTIFSLLDAPPLAAVSLGIVGTVMISLGVALFIEPPLSRWTKTALAAVVAATIGLRKNRPRKITQD
jgi:peptidoglycan/LPS O-acetylase OafA/YrhL